MRPMVTWLAATAVLDAASTALAQTAIQTPVPSILTWKGEKQAAGYRTIEAIYKTHTIKRGPRVHPLPRAARQIDPTFTYDGRTWTIAGYMKAYRVSGLLVLKDGKVVLERYGLG